MANYGGSGGGVPMNVNMHSQQQQMVQQQYRSMQMPSYAQQAGGPGPMASQPGQAQPSGMPISAQQMAMIQQQQQQAMAQQNPYGAPPSAAQTSALSPSSGHAAHATSAGAKDESNLSQTVMPDPMQTVRVLVTQHLRTALTNLIKVCADSVKAVQKQSSGTGDLESIQRQIHLALDNFYNCCDSVEQQLTLLQSMFRHSQVQQKYIPFDIKDVPQTPRDCTVSDYMLKAREHIATVQEIVECYSTSLHRMSVASKRKTTEGDEKDSLIQPDTGVGGDATLLGGLLSAAPSTSSPPSSKIPRSADSGQMKQSPPSTVAVAGSSADASAQRALLQRQDSVQILSE